MKWLPDKCPAPPGLQRRVVSGLWLRNWRGRQKISRERKVCVQRGRRALRDTVLNVFSAIEDHVLGTPLPSPQRCTALLHFERLIDLMCSHVLTYVHTYLPAYDM